MLQSIDSNAAPSHEAMAEAVGSAGSRACGVGLKLRLRIDVGGERILQFEAEAFGRAASAASSSQLRELFVNRTLRQALDLDHLEISRAIGGGSFCAVLVHEALLNAMAAYRGEIPRENGQIACRCYSVREGMIRRAVRRNQLTNIVQLAEFTRAGTACGDCAGRLRHLLEQLTGT
ncbi:MAG TPA: iron-sulfur cluster assembly scaffold protein [Polyangiaceae bacterium]|nr:iron-sulfur cluster assembly scaffold protein [Polyangiaceae bacterium]